jgi:hypothetical protein
MEAQQMTTLPPSMPSFTSEGREATMRAVADRVVKEHGPSTAKFLAALLDEAAEEVEQDHAPGRG